MAGSILDKHPGPWRVVGDDDVDMNEGWEPGDIVDGDGKIVVWSDGNMGKEDIDGKHACSDSEAMRLILAAPELLAALKYVLDHPPGTHYGSMGAEHARALIDRIEKGEG